MAASDWKPFTVILVAFVLITLSAFADKAPDSSAVVILEVYFVGRIDPVLGTGFFIDDDGLIATADHVLRGLETEPGQTYKPPKAADIERIVIHSPLLEHTIEIGKSDLTDRMRLGAPAGGGSGLDAALFRVTLPDNVKVHPLDFALDDPLPGTGYWAVGPGCIGSRDAKIEDSCFHSLSPSVSIDGSTLGATSYTVSGDMSTGFSGGPLLNSDGLVVATTSWGHALALSTAVNRAYFIPARAITNLFKLDRIPPSKLLSNAKAACGVVGSASSLSLYTFEEVMGIWQPSGQHLSSEQCLCCCTALHKFPHSPTVVGLKGIHCEKEKDCPDLELASLIEDLLKNQHPGLGNLLGIRKPNPERTARALLDFYAVLAESSASPDFNSEQKLNSFSEVLGTSVAKFQCKRVGPDACTAAISALNTRIETKPTATSLNALATIFEEQGEDQAAEAARKLTTVSYQDVGSPQFRSLKNDIQQGMFEIAAKQSITRFHFDTVKAVSGIAGREVYTVESTVTVGHGDYVSEIDPPCPEQFQKQEASVLSSIRTADSANALPEVGPLTDIAGASIWTIKGVGKEFNGWLVPQRTAQCRYVGVTLPAGAEILGINYSASEQNGTFSACTGSDLSCSVGWSRWIGPTRILEADNSTVVLAVFKNWSHDRLRNARIDVTFKTSKAID